MRAAAGRIDMCMDRGTADMRCVRRREMMSYAPQVRPANVRRSHVSTRCRKVCAADVSG